VSVIRVNLLNPEHEATGRVLWVELDKIIQLFLLLRLGGFNPRVVRKEFLSRLGRPFLLNGYVDNPINIQTTWFTKEPDILHVNWFTKNPIDGKRTSEQ
jgi:hypothetical protein